jgi:hypothetical protein
MRRVAIGARPRDRGRLAIEGFRWQTRRLLSHGMQSLNPRMQEHPLNGAVSRSLLSAFA